MTLPERRSTDEDFFPPAPSTQPLGDTRFRALVGTTDWAALPQAIRRRFSKRLAGGDSTVYRGRVVAARMSRVGLMLAQVARLVGGPLPLSRDVGAAAVVTVTEDAAGHGQHWTRLYVRRGTFPQIIHSSKRFAGPTGLEEHIGCGLGMALRVHVEPDALVFRSAGYFIDLGGRRLRLPHWMSPGDLTVAHHDRGAGRFVFDLTLAHPRLGELVHQSALFEETAS